jgi:hypothetical protein
MRKWLPPIIAGLILLLAIAPLAAAKDHGKAHPAHKAKAAQKNHKTKPAQPKAKAAPKAKGKNKFQCEAQVVSDDGATLVVMVKSGSATVRAFRGGDLTLSIPATAKLVVGQSAATGSFTLSNLPPGAIVHVGGTIDRTNPVALVYVATKIILQRLPQTTPTPAPSDSASPSPEPSGTANPEPSESPSASPSASPDAAPEAAGDASGAPLNVAQVRFGYAGVLIALDMRAHAAPGMQKMAATLLAQVAVR